MSHVQAAVLCDEAASSSTPVTLWEEKEGCKETPWCSGSEQQFRKSDAITFVV